MNITQIQISPVDNGFLVQVVSLDGDKLNKKLVATDVEDVRKKLHEFADAFYVKEEKPDTGTSATKISAPTLPREPR